MQEGCKGRRCQGKVISFRRILPPLPGRDIAADLITKRLGASQRYAVIRNGGTLPAMICCSYRRGSPYAGNTTRTAASRIPRRNNGGIGRDEQQGVACERHVIGPSRLALFLS